MQGEGIDIKKYTLGNITSRTKGDKVIWAIVVLLTMMSLLAVYSSTGTLAYKLSRSTESYLFKQVVFIAIGVAIIYFAHLLNYTIYSRLALILFVLSVPLLFYTLLFSHEKINPYSSFIFSNFYRIRSKTKSVAVRSNQSYFSLN